MKYALLLQWWMVFVLSLLFSVICWSIGWFQAIYEKDTSNISFFIIGYFWVIMLYQGYLSLLVCKGNLNDEKMKFVEYGENASWLSSEIFQSLGLLGTLFGFLMILGGTGFSGINASDAASLQKLLAEMSGGFGVAIITTITGLITSVIMKLQCFNLSQTMDQIRSKNVK